MKSIQTVFHFPKRMIRHIQRKRFRQQFPKIDSLSVIGTDGMGKGCTLEGGDRLSIGPDTFVGEGSELLVYQTHFDQPLDSHLIIGKHVRITARCRITCAGTIRIGDDALFGPDVFITDHNHGMDPEALGGYSPQKINVQDVTIEEGVWLGQRVCVLPGITIGAHSIVGTNSVVTHDIPSYSMAVGSPAKVIKKWNFERKCWEHA